nr:hypothetical protein KitaXyl93_22880 [Kitasatospora sp. Xyl93]
MSTLSNSRAYGIDEVMQLEASLAASLPEPGAAETVCTAALDRLQADASRRQTQFKRDAELLRPVADRLLEVPGLKDASGPIRADQRSRIETKAKTITSTPEYLPALEAQFDGNTNSAVKTPPYDGQFINTGSHSFVTAHDGQFEMSLNGIGLSTSAALTMGSWFFTPVNDFALQLTTNIWFNRDWHQDAMGFVAHSHFSTVFMIWDDTVKQFLPTSPVGPSWDDGVGWFESHGDHRENEWVVAETTFPATAGHWYFIQVSLSASVDAERGPLAESDSLIHVWGFVPYLMLGPYL